MDALINLSNRATLSLRTGIRFSNMLEMGEEQVAQLISLVENEPLFQKFFRAQDQESKIFSRQRFPSTHLSSSFYEFKEELHPSQSGAELKQALLENQALLKEIEKIGRENFEKYFLYDDGSKSAGEIARELGIPEATAKAIVQLTEKVLIQREFSSAPGDYGKDAHPEPALAYTKIAAYEVRDIGKYEIQFFSALMARGLYQIHYERLRKLKKSNQLSDDEKRKVREIIKWIELINARKNLIYRLLKILPDLQKDFFLKGENEQLFPLTQREVARKLNVTPSAISRAISRRSAVLPQGREMPLQDFFLSRKIWLKERLTTILEEKKGLSDTKIQELVKKDFGISLSRRSINQYRQEIEKASG